MKKTMYGFSIVELMVSLVLGSMLTLAAVQLFGVNQRTFITQQSLARVLDDGQLALRFLSDDIRRAGYSGATVANDDGIIFGGTGSVDGNPFDRIQVSYVGTQDCQGSVSAVPVALTNIYFVNAAGELRCDGSLGGGDVVLLDGVEGFRVQYGVDTVQDEVAGPFAYVGAGAAAGLARPVVAIRLGLLLGSNSPALPQNATRSWQLYDRQINTGADNVTRRVFFTTVMLRNLNWETL
ncbi:PilW family protein [Alcanivorax sp. 1008]|uniref:PilW family protein n=1 Tax=Alcanivorax sp. 1008 TaxID=2816853 RepID=UPI001DDA08B5|nr:PilW family protein [Alcanivorax sp. 1008]MCC1496555.1 PilW family protein [Alcanivorax sp. 1008]